MVLEKVKYMCYSSTRTYKNRISRLYGRDFIRPEMAAPGGGRYEKRLL